MKNLILEWKVRGKDLLIYTEVLLGAWIFGIVLMYIMQTFVKQGECFPVGSLCAAIVGIILCLLGFASDFTLGFDLAVGFGRVRKKYLPSVLTLYVIQGLVLLVELRIFTAAEPLVYKFMFQEAKTITTDSFYVSFFWMIIYAVILAGAAGAVGMIVHRFRKGATVLTVLWCLGVIFVQSDSQVMKKGAEIAGRFLRLPMGIQMASGLLLGVILCTASFAGMR